jgi:tRNA pseudouridine13 synthase
VDVDVLPRTGTAAAAGGRYRLSADDFVVDELLGYVPTGHGEHLYLRLEKRAENTQWVARALARHFGVAPLDVGFAGQKDRHAVARQWFSVRLPGVSVDAPVSLPADARITLLEHGWHDRKLRPGAHTGNRFVLRLRQLYGDLGAIEQRLQAFARAPTCQVPNYFGPQRFGRDGANTDLARRWLLEGRPRPRSREERSRLLSVARAFLFNHVLAARVLDGSWATPLEGDHCIDDLPTGPLWGRGRSATGGRPGGLEATALEPHQAWLDPLEHCGLRQDRRPLPATVAEFEGERAGAELRLAFALPAGSFATSVLRELGTFADVHEQAGDGRVSDG